MEKKEIVFIYRHWSRFQETTVRMLSERYNVVPVEYKNIFSVIEILKKIKRNNISISHWAGRHAAFANILGKLIGHKTIVIVSGYEVAKMPEISYGALISPIGRAISHLAIDFATWIVVISEYLREELFEFTPRRKNIFLTSAPNSVDIDFFIPGNEKKKKQILCVAEIGDRHFITKGMQTYVECAKKLSEYNFIWVGRQIKKENNKFLTELSLPPNLQVLKNLSREEVRKIMQESAVYCQLSYVESFGVALAEAMACECVPVVTARGGMKEVVGDTGIVVPYGDVDATVKAIKYAMEHPELGKRARQRIVEKYSYQKLKEEFLAIMEKIYPP
jgi:glycosyltransferase involved in cell wall biosynthesis